MQNIFDFKDEEFVADPILKYNKKDHKNDCIIIDNGSHSCRAGWSSDEKPKLIFRNLVAKHRGKKETEASNNYYFGNDIKELEDSKWNIRTQFDMNIVTHFDTQENGFDYLFSHLGIDTNGKVCHPVCITEGVCIPNMFRHHMSEMLFECYNVPKVIYGIDALFSINHNFPNVDHALIVSCGYQSTHVLPIVCGKFDAASSRRLNLGGLNLMIYLRRLLQLRYPIHSSMINLSRAQELLINYSYVATDYFEELKKWQNINFSRQQTVNIQIPVVNTTTEKDIEMRRAQAMRLKEINQKKREEKIKKEEEQLASFENILELGSSNSSAFKAQLKSAGLQKEKDLVDVIDELKDRIATRKHKSVQYYRELDSGGKTNPGIPEGITIEQVENLIANLEEEKLVINDKQRSRLSRKQALNKRKSYASKERMRILSQLAKSGTKISDKGEKEDTFGMNDDDWDVYKFINKDGSESEEEQEQERLNEIEQSLSQYQLLINRLMIGRGQKYQYLPYNTEQIRTPELLFQPSIAGTEQEGIIGMVEYVLKNYDSETRDKLIQNIFITGGLANIPNFKERLSAEIMSILPFQSKFNVYLASDCSLDSWFGAKDFVNQQTDLNSIAMLRNEYEEEGIGYIKEHRCSNLYVQIND